jgi:hypothetical protein
MAALLTMRSHTFGVMPGHSRSKNGVLKDAYDPGIHEAVLQARNYVSLRSWRGLMDRRVKPGDDG